jgi:rSAM/selenodomain-associated transferase 2
MGSAEEIGNPLSIIIPVLDEAACVEQALRALQPLRARGNEVIVVDGGSRDGSRELARPWVDKLLSAPCGRARQMNAGGARASRPVLLFLHVDTRLPDSADRIVSARLADSGWRWGHFNVALSGRSLWFRLIETMMNWRSRVTGIATGDQAIFVTRELFDEAGGFPAIPLMEDIAWSKQVRGRCPPLCLEQRVLTASRRWEQNGVLWTIVQMWLLRAGYFLGVDPHRLARYYGYG